jgi:hypothetical protein
MKDSHASIKIYFRFLKKNKTVFLWKLKSDLILGRHVSAWCSISMVIPTTNTVLYNIKREKDEVNINTYNIRKNLKLASKL